MFVMASMSIRSLILSSREKQHKFTDRLLAIPPVELVYRTISQFRDDDGTHLAAGVAYYGMLSIFPLLVGIMAIASYIVDPYKQCRQWYLSRSRPALLGPLSSCSRGLPTSSG
jgi:hypothetical protein